MLHCWVNLNSKGLRSCAKVLPVARYVVFNRMLQNVGSENIVELKKWIFLGSTS